MNAMELGIWLQAQWQRCSFFANGTKYMCRIDGKKHAKLGQTKVVQTLPINISWSLMNKGNKYRTKKEWIKGYKRKKQTNKNFKGVSMISKLYLLIIVNQGALPLGNPQPPNLAMEGTHGGPAPCVSHAAASVSLRPLLCWGSSTTPKKWYRPFNRPTRLALRSDS